MIDKLITKMKISFSKRKSRLTISLNYFS